MSDILERLTRSLTDRYQVQKELGQGGMATVYLAADLKHDRKVAIKVLRPELAAVVGAERFLSEIRTTANLQHPHILPLFDSGEADGFLYYVMPYMAGETLRDRLDREKQLPIEEAVTIAMKVGSALDYAHRQGVIHRDIKPANILLEDGEPQVADFGIALAVQQAGGGRLTETGLSLGTPYYMSPEQATGDREPDLRSDLYSLGCVAFEMLAGEPPFTGSTAQSVLAKILTEDTPAVTRFRKTVPLHIASAVAKATQRLPADRFATIGEFVAALSDASFRWGDLASVGTGSGRGADSGGSARVWQITTAVLAVAGLALVGLLLQTDSTPLSAPLTLRVTMPDSQRVINPGDFMSADLSDDGSTLVYVGPEGDDGTQLWVKRRGEIDASPLRGTTSPVMFTVSPDGSEVAYMRNGSPALAAISTSGGSPRALADSAQALGGDWGEDGYIYFQNFGSGLSRVSARGGAPEILFDPGASGATGFGGSGDVAWPQLLPGGKALILAKWGITPAADSIAIFDLEDRSMTTVTRGVNAAYVTPGYLLIGSTDRTLSLGTFDLTTRELGPLRSLMDGVRNAQSGALDFTVNAAGDLIYVSGGGSRGRPAWVSRDGSAEVIQSDWLEYFTGISLSPDGSRLAAATVNGPRQDLWIRSSDVGDIPPQRLSFGEIEITRPVFTSSGDSVVYIGRAEGASSTQALVRRWDGTGQMGVMLDVPQLGADQGVQEVEISADGRWMVYRVGGGNATRDIYYFDLTRDTVGHPLIAEQANEHSPRLSPDGRFLAYGSNESGRDEIYVRTFPDLTGGKWLASANGGTEPLWSRNGTEIFYKDPDRTLIAATWGNNGRGGVVSREPLFDARGYYRDDVHSSYDVHPDGRFLMVELSESSEAGLVWMEGFSRLLEATYR